MGTVAHVTGWIGAARREAILARHHRVEATDLLLGLLAQGGEIAELLGACGITLSAARTQAIHLDDEDMTRAGITVPGTLRPARIPVGALTGQDAIDIDLSPAAEEVVWERRGKTRTDVQSLLALTDGPDSDSSRLLAALGVDVLALRTQLGSQLGSQPSRGGRARDGSQAVVVPVPSEYRDEGMEHARRVSRFISEQPDRLRELLADPDHLASWRSLVGTVTRDGDDLLTEAEGRSGTVRSRHRLVRRAEYLDWREDIESGRYTGQLGCVHRLEVRTAPGGAQVGLTLMLRSFGPVGRALAPVVRPWSGFGLRDGLARIAALAADQPS